MSNFLTITDNGTITLTAKELTEISEEKLYKWIRYSINAEADELRSYIVRNWASGRTFTERTGLTREHIGVYQLFKRNRKKETITVVRPGKGVSGMQNWIEKWTGTRFEFMRPAFQAFGIEKRLAQSAEENLSRMIAKEGLA